MKSKKAQGMLIAVILVILVAVGVGAVVWMAVSSGGDTQTQQIVQQAAQAAQQGKSGDVASVGVYVRNIANDDVNTKVAVAVYCQGDDGSFIIDGTSSSTSAEITGKSTIGTTVTCWAFNSTFQTYEPAVVKIDSEIEHIVIDGYAISLRGSNDFYSDTFTVADNSTVNITLTSEGSDTFQKMKFTNIGTDKFLPLGGFYFDLVENTNMSSIDITGAASTSGRAVTNDKSDTNIVRSSLSTKVSTRKSKWDEVFEIDDGNAIQGNDGYNPILLDQNDFIESGIVSVESTNSAGCPGGDDSLDSASLYAFMKGYYRSSTEDAVKYGHETDAVSAAVIASDIEAEYFTCDVA